MYQGQIQDLLRGGSGVLIIMRVKCMENFSLTTPTFSLATPVFTLLLLNTKQQLTQKINRKEHTAGPFWDVGEFNYKFIKVQIC